MVGGGTDFLETLTTLRRLRFARLMAPERAATSLRSGVPLHAHQPPVILRRPGGIGFVEVDVTIAAGMDNIFVAYSA